MNFEVEDGCLILNFPNPDAARMAIAAGVVTAWRERLRRFPQIQRIILKVDGRTFRPPDLDIRWTSEGAPMTTGSGFRECMDWFLAHDGPATLTFHDNHVCWIQNDRYSLERLGGVNSEQIEGASFVAPRAIGNRIIPAHWAPSLDRLHELAADLQHHGEATCRYFGLRPDGQIAYYELEYKLFPDVRGRPVRASRSKLYELKGTPDAIVSGNIPGTISDDLMQRAQQVLAVRDRLSLP